MDRRKSLGVALLTNTVEMNEGNSSPLRRRSSFGLTIPKSVSTIVENDDEAERLARRKDRRQEISETPTSSTSDKRRSLGLSNIAHIPAGQISEKISQCIKLSTENKINSKNAFGLEIIDFMTYLIKKKDKEMSNLQVASTSLDVSAKIYGFRVDGVHTDMLKMIGGLDKQDKKNDEKNDDEQGENAQGVEGNNEADMLTQKKKKKRSPRNILGSEESFKCNVDVVNPMSLLMGDGDSQTTDLLFQAMLPLHENGNIYLDSFSGVVYDTVPEEKPAVSKEIEFSNFKINYDHEICPPFSNFQIIGWSVDDEPEEQPHNDSKFQFDLDASLPADDVGNSRMDIFDVDDDYHEDVDRFGANTRQVENIVDFSGVIASSGTKSNFEYSYLQDSLASQIQWVGPLHWKVRLNKSIANSRVVGKPAAHKDTVRRKKEVTIDQKKDEVRDAIQEKFLPGHAIKLLVKTAKVGWAEDKITYPKNEHYDMKNIGTFYFRPQLHFSIPREENVNATHLSDEVDNYDYNNEHDVSNYCPNIQNDDYQGGDDNDNGALSGFNSEMEHITPSQGIFAGDNLVAAPKIANKIFIPYSLRAKKIDMRQLKKTIWKCLTRTISDKENIDIREAVEQELADNVKEEKSFCSVYQDLPKFLSKSNSEALSLPIAFVSMLHLANEKNLEVKSSENLDDLRVKQN